MRSLYFVTTNDNKFRFFSSCFTVKGWSLVQKKVKIPEIQAYSTRIIAARSAEFAADQLNLPVVKEDVGLFIESLGGFPGPFLKQIEKWLSIDDFQKLLANNDRNPAYWEYSVAFALPGKEAKVFTTKHQGTMAYKAKGISGCISDKLFVPKNERRTIAEMLDNNAYHKESSHYFSLQSYLLTLKKRSFR